MSRNILLDKLCREHPDAYIKIGNDYFPTRHELFDYELIKNSFKHNMFKCHNDLPILLTVQESQRMLFEALYNYLVFQTKINFKSFSLDDQIEFILLLKGICNDNELMKLIDSSKLNYYECSRKLFHNDVWVKLMDYMITTTFIEKQQRLEILVFRTKVRKSFWNT